MAAGTRRPRSRSSRGPIAVAVSRPMVPAVTAALLGRRVLVRACMRPDGFGSMRNLWMASDFNGAFAQYVTVPASEVFAVECDWSDAELATIPCAYATAETMLHRAGCAAGDEVLVTGASGGVGSAALQLAKRRGARVTALTSAAKADAVSDLRRRPRGDARRGPCGCPRHGKHRPRCRQCRRRRVSDHAEAAPPRRALHLVRCHRRADRRSRHARHVSQGHLADRHHRMGRAGVSERSATSRPARSGRFLPRPGHLARSPPRRRRLRGRTSSAISC